MAPADYAKLYDAYYFRHGCGAPYQRTPDRLQFFDSIAARLVREIGPRTALDAGCAMGFLVEGLRARGVEAFGLDVSEFALQQVREDLRPYCRLGSLAQPFEGRYDLIVCIEVLEHLPPAEGAQAIENLCRAADDIVFSSTPLDYREATHFNVQEPGYWAERFGHHGFARDVDFDASFITPWAARFRKTGEPWPRQAHAYERRLWQLAQENADLRQQSVETREQLAVLEEAVRRLEAPPPPAGPSAEAQALRAELAEIQRSRAWRLAQFIWRVRRRLAPPKNGARP